MVSVGLSLQASFERAWCGCGAQSMNVSLFNALLAAYAQAHRQYHTCQHLSECLQRFEAVRTLAQEPAEIELALWFHDAVYELKRSDNEAQSAIWLKRELAAIQAPVELIERAVELVMATRHSGVPATRDQQLLVDIDLSILGAPVERFKEYEQQIRAEYAFVPNWIFRRKRRAILKAFVDRPQIYSTAYFQQAIEQQARENLAGVLRSSE